MGKLSKREKVLIYIMVTLLTAVGIGVFMIQPAAEAASSLEEQISEKSAVKMGMEQKLQSEGRLLKDVEAYRQGIAKLSEGFLSPMTNDQLDAYLTGLLENTGFLRKPSPSRRWSSPRRVKEKSRERKRRQIPRRRR